MGTMTEAERFNQVLETVQRLSNAVRDGQNTTQTLIKSNNLLVEGLRKQDIEIQRLRNEVEHFRNITKPFLVKKCTCGGVSNES